LEQALLVLRTQANAAVLDSQSHTPPPGRSGLTAGDQADPTLVGELDGIGHQVEQHLPQALAIDQARNGGHLVEVERDLQSLGLGPNAQGLDHGVKQLGQHRRLQIELQAARVDAGRIQ